MSNRARRAAPTYMHAHISVYLTLEHTTEFTVSQREKISQG